MRDQRIISQSVCPERRKCVTFILNHGPHSRLHADGEIDRQPSLRPVIGVVAELQSRAEMTKSVLDLYLGREAGRRVYAGNIRRGDGQTIHSVL
jgi:hypothetical protein